MKLKTSESNKTSQIVIRITESQRKKLEAIAKQNSLSLSKTIRAMIEVIIK